jgi:hypothetical protein
MVNSNTLLSCTCRTRPQHMAIFGRLDHKLEPGKAEFWNENRVRLVSIHYFRHQIVLNKHQASLVIVPLPIVHLRLLPSPSAIPVATSPYKSCHNCCKYQSGLSVISTCLYPFRSPTNHAGTGFASGLKQFGVDSHLISTAHSFMQNIFNFK